MRARFKHLGFLFLFTAILVMAKPIMGCHIAAHLTPHNHAQAFLLHKLLSRRKQDFTTAEFTDELGAMQLVSHLQAYSYKKQLFTFLLSFDYIAKITRKLLLFIRNSLPAPPPLYLLFQHLSI